MGNRFFPEVEKQPVCDSGLELTRDLLLHVNVKRVLSEDFFSVCDNKLFEFLLVCVVMFRVGSTVSQDMKLISFFGFLDWHSSSLVMLRRVRSALLCHFKSCLNEQLGMSEDQNKPPPQPPPWKSEEWVSFFKAIEPYADKFLQYMRERGEEEHRLQRLGVTHDWRIATIAFIFLGLLVPGGYCHQGLMAFPKAIAGL